MQVKPQDGGTRTTARPLIGTTVNRGELKHFLEFGLYMGPQEAMRGQFALWRHIVQAMPAEQTWCKLCQNAATLCPKKDHGRHSSHWIIDRQAFCQLDTTMLLPKSYAKSVTRRRIAAFIIYLRQRGA